MAPLIIAVVLIFIYDFVNRKVYKSYSSLVETQRTYIIEIEKRLDSKNKQFFVLAKYVLEQIKSDSIERQDYETAKKCTEELIRIENFLK